MGERIVVGYWDCPYCGRKGIKGTIYDCPGCGRQRGKETKFYMKAHKEYLDNDPKYKLVDWYCEYCGSLNSGTLNRCENCGSPKEEAKDDYFTLKEKEKKQKEEPKEEIKNDIDELVSSVKNMDEINKEIEKVNDEIQTNLNKFQEIIKTKDKPKKKEKRYDNFTLLDTIKRKFKKYKKEILIGSFSLIGIILLGFFIKALVTPRTYEYEVTDMQWQSNIEVEEYKTVRESDWSVPPGGRVVYTREEVSGYVEVIDHYEQVQHSRQVQSGGHYVTHHSITYTDNGNGTFTEHDNSYNEYVPDYTTEYYYTSEPVYREEPVYSTKYYYDIDKWVYKETLSITGNDKKPYYDKFIPNDKLRESRRYIKYNMTGNQKGDLLFTKKDSKIETYALNENDYKEIYVGNKLEIIVKLGNIIEYKVIS